eukprot:5192115-Pyramimonas_sp.AAC.1
MQHVKRITFQLSPTSAMHHMHCLRVVIPHMPCLCMRECVIDAIRAQVGPQLPRGPSCALVAKVAGLLLPRICRAIPSPGANVLRAKHPLHA